MSERTVEVLCCIFLKNDLAENEKTLLQSSVFGQDFYFLFQLRRKPLIFSEIVSIDSSTFFDD